MCAKPCGQKQVQVDESESDNEDEDARPKKKQRALPKEQKAAMYKRRLKQYAEAKERQRATAGRGVEPAASFDTLKHEIKNLDAFLTGPGLDGKSSFVCFAM